MSITKVKTINVSSVNRSYDLSVGGCRCSECPADESQDVMKEPLCAGVNHKGVVGRLAKNK